MANVSIRRLYLDPKTQDISQLKIKKKLLVISLKMKR